MGFFLFHFIRLKDGKLSRHSLLLFAAHGLGA
jgi:hypothetical protein